MSKIYLELGITGEHLKACQLSACEQASFSKLVVADIYWTGKPFVLDQRTAEAWQKMRASAERDQVILEPISGFRSYVHQKQLISQKLSKGQSLESILTQTAIPGFSEHHGGCAIDISSEGIFELSENFEKSQAFQWLTGNAHRYGFKLSYPRDNPMGIIYEPWHWCKY